ncbi:MAG TPA: hypothetical protein VGE74_15850 [Gemmata sp.]
MAVRFLGGVFGLAGAALLVGCGGSGPAPATVSGEVKVNGVAVEKGVISYIPADSTGAPATGDIKNGRYEIATTAGKKRVQISVPVVKDRRKESQAPDAQWVEITAETLPEKYNAKTELTFDVVAGSNTKDWALDTKKK